MMDDKKLLEIAKDAQCYAYAPYSGYMVGAALLCSDGTVYTGCNVENISYGATICAERSAFIKALSEGKRGFSKLAISVSGDEIGLPCGICRQVISEFVDDKDFLIICGNNQNEYKSFLYSELMPFAFSTNCIKRKSVRMRDNGSY